MAIATEILEQKWIDGTNLIKTYSDIHHYIISDETGAKYTEAIDPECKHRTYTESDEPIEEES